MQKTSQTQKNLTYEILKGLDFIILDKDIRHKLKISEMFDNKTFELGTNRIICPNLMDSKKFPTSR